MQVVNISTAPQAGALRVTLPANSGPKVSRSDSPTGPTAFFYTVAADAPYTAADCSLGVYLDDRLIRTLFSNERLNNGTYFGCWDGLDDRGHAPNRTGKVLKYKLLYSNLVHVWGGGWGNNSTAMTGLQKHRGGDPNANLLLFNDTNNVPTVSYKHGFEEGAVPASGFAVEDMLTRVDIANNGGGAGLSINWQATNGEILLNSGGDPYNTRLSFVYATNIGDKNKTLFDAGQVAATNTGVPYSSAIDMLLSADDRGLPTGLTIVGSYAYHSRGGLDSLHVLDLGLVNGKPSGRLAHQLTLPGAGVGVADNGAIWLAHDGDKFSRYSCNADGSLGAVTLAIADSLQVVGASIWQDELRLACAGNRHTVRVYNRTTGQFLRENHPLGGAKASTVVTPTTLLFYFSGKDLGSIVSLPNGDYILAVPGLWRTVRYSATGQLVKMLMQVPRNYENTLCQNEPNLNFAGHQEYTINHLDPNYRTAATLTHCRELFTLPGYGNINPKFHTKFPSGRIFCQFPNFNFDGSGYNQTIAEVTETEGYRFVRNVNVEGSLYPDCSLRWQEVRLGGLLCSVRQDCLDPMALNPAWGPAYVFDSVALETHDNPPGGSTLRGEVTGSGISVSWDVSLRYEEESGNHLLLYKNGKRLAATYPALPQNPLIPFNRHGKFRTAGWARGIENGRPYIISGGSSDRAQVFGPNREIIRMHFHDEFNRTDTQSNQNVFFHECGLMLGTFGNTGAELNGDTAAANACGNAINSMTQFIPGLNVWRTVYSGETVHAIHFFDTTNLESIRLVEIEA